MHTLKKSKTLKDHNHLSSLNADKSDSLNISITSHAKKITFSHNSNICFTNVWMSASSFTSWLVIVHVSIEEYMRFLPYLILRGGKK